MTGRELKVLMAQHDLTQKLVAHIAGKSQPTICSYIKGLENGGFKIPSDVEQKILNYVESKKTAKAQS